MDRDRDAPITGLVLHRILDLSKQQEQETHSILASEEGMNHWKTDPGAEPEHGEDGPVRPPSLGMGASE